MLVDELGLEGVEEALGDGVVEAAPGRLVLRRRPPRWASCWTRSERNGPSRSEWKRRPGAGRRSVSARYFELNGETYQLA
jgi:hypothetical protein